MVLPEAIDPEIGSQRSFAPESGFFKHTDRPGVAGNTGSFDPVQPQRIKGEPHQHVYRIRHQPAPGIALADPVADMATLRDAMADIAERDAAGKLAALEDEEG